jgi:hypothetical protein
MAGVTGNALILVYKLELKHLKQWHSTGTTPRSSSRHRFLSPAFSKSLYGDSFLEATVQASLVSKASVVHDRSWATEVGLKCYKAPS